MSFINSIIEKIIKNYSPPVVFGNEKRIKEDMLIFLLCMTEDILTVLNSGLSDAETAEKLRAVFKAQNLTL